MNCHACGKKLVAGYALCGECGGHLGNGIEQTRLGYFVQHPDRMVDGLLHDAPWCKSLAECIADANRDEMIAEEKCKKCILDWLMEVVK